MIAGPIGLLGGTFDPVHIAHLRLAEEALDRLALGSVRWIPSGQPGHRGAPVAGVEHRLAMLMLAIAAEPRFTLDDADARASVPTFTINTLTRLRAALGSETPLVLIIGADQLLALDTWREWKRLFGLAHIAVAQRPRFEVRPDALPGDLVLEYGRRSAAPADLATAPAGRIAAFEMTPLEISASAIRADIAAGRSPRYLLPDAVLDYIDSHRLYSSREAGTH
jgi:nicotinate-nucleotide adenylyltransferase